MLFKIHYVTGILALIQLLPSLVLATPNLGIRADFLDATGKTTDRDIQSYSSIIKFKDGTIPLDTTKMTDAKLLNLCVVAYNEMVDLWRTRNLRSAALPGAMAAIAYKDKIYFASSLRAPAAVVKLANVAKGSVREMMDEALTMGVGTHAHGGGCSEINCIELLWSDNGQQDPDKGPPAPRVAIWVLPTAKSIDTNSEVNAPPCTWGSRAGQGYGCAEIVLEYGINPIDKNAAPDATGQDDWDFSLEANPRPPCER